MNERKIHKNKEPANIKKDRPTSSPQTHSRHHGRHRKHLSEARLTILLIY